MPYIDAIYYINLDHRNDRRESIQKQIDFLVEGDPRAAKVHVQRIPGVNTPGFGILGCGQAHIHAIETFLESPFETCLIMEDDFVFTQSHEVCRNMLHTFFDDFGSDWDVLMLASNTYAASHFNGYLDKCIDAQTASCYLLHKTFAVALLETLKEGILLLEKTRNPVKYANDIYWKRLQPSSRWYICRPKLGLQAPSYSDIAGYDVNYGV